MSLLHARRRPLPQGERAHRLPARVRWQRKVVVVVWAKARMRCVYHSADRRCRNPFFKRQARFRTSRGARRPRDAVDMPSRNDEGAGKTGCWPHPWSACNKKHAAEPQAQPKTTGLPCAMVLRLIRALPGAPGFLATMIRAKQASQRLHDVRAHVVQDTSVGVSGPHDFAVRHPASRPRLATHLTRQRPSHCRPNVS